MTRPVLALIKRNLIKLYRDKMRLFLSLFMSGMFLFIFSFITNSAMSRLAHPMNYLISGIIIMTVFQTALNNSMHILEDISTGFMKEILVAPIARWQIAIGQILSSTVIAIAQGLLIVVIGLFMGLNLDPIHAVLMIALMVLVGLTFSSLGLYLAAISKDSTNFQMVVAIVTVPLTFLSGAYIPTVALPGILLPVVYLNPLTYTTAAFRYITLHMEGAAQDMLVKTGMAFNINGFIITPLMGSALVLLMGLVFFQLCVRRFSTADFSNVKVFTRGHRR